VAYATSTLTGKKRETRKTKPDGVGLIEQDGDASYVAYTRTDDNIRKRLRQHLLLASHLMDLLAIKIVRYKTGLGPFNP